MALETLLSSTRISSQPSLGNPAADNYAILDLYFQKPLAGVSGMIKAAFRMSLVTSPAIVHVVNN